MVAAPSRDAQGPSDVLGDRYALSLTQGGGSNRTRLLLLTRDSRPVCLQLLHRRDDLLNRLLGIAEQHQIVLVVEQRIVDSGESR